MQHGRRNTYKRIAGIGPGGMKCPCCGPPTGNRKSLRRLVRTRLKVEVRKEIEVER